MKKRRPQRIGVMSMLALSFALSGCVTQVITTPVQVANQTTQTAAQTAGQAAQAATPGLSALNSEKGFTGQSQSSAYGLDVKKPHRSRSE